MFFMFVSPHVFVSPVSFRDGPKHQTRNLEIPGSTLTPRPGMTFLFSGHQPFLDRLDLQCELLRADPALREPACDEPETGLAGADIHVAQLLRLAKAPDRSDSSCDSLAEQLAHQLFLRAIAGRQHDKVGSNDLAALHLRTF